MTIGRILYATDFSPAWTLGSVARHVIQAAPCPVLTVGREGRKKVSRRVA